jgi:hypothetical protein
MPILIINIFPYDKNIIIDLDDNFCKRVIKKINKYKSSLGKIDFHIPEIGFRGMELHLDKNTVLYVYKDIIIIKENGIIILKRDNKEKIYNFLLKKILEKYFMK